MSLWSKIRRITRQILHDLLCNSGYEGFTAPLRSQRQMEGVGSLRWSH
jgi:hypothetical protein